MEKIEFDVELTVRDLYGFSMRHTYTGASGIFGLVISFGSLVVLALRYGQLDVNARLALLIIGCLFTVVQPIMLYTKAKAQVRQNKNINAPLHYRLTETEIVVAQGEQEACVKWHEVRRRVRTKGAVYLYMSPVRAFIFPAGQCGTSFSAVCDYIDTQLQRCKNYAPSQGEQQDDNKSNQEEEKS